MKRNGFIATSVLYSLVALVALVMLIIVKNYSTVVKINREESKGIKENLYDASSDVIISWRYPEELGVSPSEFPGPDSNYKVVGVECTPSDFLPGQPRGIWNETTWKLEVDLRGIASNGKVRCTLELALK